MSAKVVPMSQYDNTPVVSVVMPVFNAGKYLSKAIQSILDQTFQDFEFIIINDGSTDDSWATIQRYANNDERIIAVNRDNAGVVKAANYAASIAKGTYLSRTDADDLSFSTKLEDLVQCANRNPKAIVITGSIEVIDDRDEFLYRELVPIFNDGLKRALYVRNAIPNGATLVRKDAFDKVGGFANVFAEDCYLWSELWSEGDFVGTGTAVYKWRLNNAGLTFTNLAKSMAKEREYLSNLWRESPPYLVRRTDIAAVIATYQAMPGRFQKDYITVYINDLSRVATRQIRIGNINQGIAQMWHISTSGRVGLSATITRLALLVRGSVYKLLKVRQPPTLSYETTHAVDL